MARVSRVGLRYLTDGGGRVGGLDGVARVSRVGLRYLTLILILILILFIEAIRNELAAITASRQNNKTEGNIVTHTSTPSALILTYIHTLTLHTHIPLTHSRTAVKTVSSKAIK